MNRLDQRSRCARAMTATFVAAVLSAGTACGRTDAGSEPLAKVNGAIITQAQLTALLAERLPATAVATPAQQREALDEMIDRSLLVDAAYAEGLHKRDGVDPEDRKVLAQMYLNKQLAAIPEVTEADLRLYYDAEPDLFEQRKRFDFQEIAIRAAGADLQALTAQYEKVGTLAELVAWVEDRKLEYKVAAATRLASTLPMDLLPHVVKTPKNGLVKIDTPVGITVMQVLEIHPDPLSFDRARDDIRRFLENKRVEIGVKATIAALRSKAVIERMGPTAESKGKP